LFLSIKGKKWAKKPLRIFVKNQDKERHFLVSMKNQKGSVLNTKKGGRCLEAPNQTCHAVAVRSNSIPFGLL